MIAPAVLLVGAVGVVGVLAGWHALSAADSLEQAQARLAGLEASTTAPADTGEALRTAAGAVADAETALERWPVDVVAAVPVLGRSWDAERAVAATARHAIDGAVVLVEGLTQVRAGAGGVDLAGLAEIRSSLSVPAADARAALERLRATPTALTPPQVGQGVDRALEGLGPAVSALGDAHAGLGLVHGLLGGSGPRNVLVMLQNNAELRGAGGYAATFATGRLDAGRLQLGPLRDVTSVWDPPRDARVVPAPEEYAEDYAAHSANSTMWRSWNMSPHVPDSALVGARIAGVLLEDEPGLLQQAPDVVVLLDVPALGALAALGDSAITLPDGSRIGPEELTDALLVDAYASAGEDTQAQLRRRAALQGAATTAVARLLAGDVPGAAAARTLARLSAERHLAVWSARPEEQQVLEQLGAAGAVLPPPAGDLSHVSVNNIGGNKLDQYVERNLSVDVVLDGETASVTQRVQFVNEAPPDLVPYVAGFDRPGVVVSRVEFSLPPGAQGVSATVDGRPWDGPLHAGPTRDRLSTVVELPRGAVMVLEVRYSLPVRDGRYVLRAVPQPLVKDADLRLSLRAADGVRLGRLTGAERTSAGAVVVEGPLVRTREVAVELASPPQSRWERLRDWWGSPVRL